MKKKYLIRALIIGAIILAVVVPQLVSAACGDPTAGLNGGINCGSSPISVQDGVKRSVNILLYITGISAVIVSVVGGLRYVLSGGDPKNTAAAKDTIMYAAIGLVVSLLAFAIVNFVLSQFS